MSLGNYLKLRKENKQIFYFNQKKGPTTTLGCNVKEFTIKTDKITDKGADTNTCDTMHVPSGRGIGWYIRHFLPRQRDKIMEIIGMKKYKIPKPLSSVIIFCNF